MSYQINSQISREITGAYKSEIFVKNRMKQMLKFIYKFAKILLGWVGFPKSYVIFRVGYGKCLRQLTRWVGGVKKGQKYAYVIFEWSLI